MTNETTVILSFPHNEVARINFQLANSKKGSCHCCFRILYYLPVLSGTFTRQHSFYFWVAHIYSKCAILVSSQFLSDVDSTEEPFFHESISS